MPAQIQSVLFRLGANDFIKGCALVVIVAVLGAVQQALTAHGLDVGSYDWGSIVNIALTAGVGYLVKNFVTASNGKILGRI